MRRKLTARTRLDTLRKDAKRWLKSLRAGDPAARSRLDAAWPKAPAAPALRDLQHALAVEYGQPSWIALKAALDDLALDRKTHAERVDQLLRHGWDGDLSAARRILARYPQIATDSLFTAAACGDLGEVERRLAADPQAALRTGGPRAWTALAYVTYSRLDEVNALAIARRLLDAGADPNFAFDDGWGIPFKVLTGAVRLGEGARPSHAQATELVELLISAGADPFDIQTLYNVSIVGEPLVEPLYWYDLLWRHCEASGQLGRWRTDGEASLGHGFGLSTLDYLLGNAVGQDERVRAEWLLDRGADPNTHHAYAKQPLHAVAQLSGFLDLQGLLERRGARPVELTGAEAFQAACRRHDAPAVRALAAADPALLRHPAPLLAAAMFGDAESVGLLLELGADAHGLDDDGISPLHRAVQSGSPAAVDRLLDAGADPNLRDRKWRGTALSWAVALGRPQLFERLLPISRDVRALARLAAFERLEAVLKAEPALANQRLAEDDSPTPLYCLPDDEDAAAEVARRLIAHGADPTVRDANGRTPADAARARGLDEAAELMEGPRHAV
ncbi:ankyrin repeat domain-containing protein [Phenylobacterium sp.]|uniref:ankyrin repeat domain-containing protein n=1 Tax=Phenylobacterium sp. TaxID=1871053 RepID=UPI00121BE7FB|nr:ankyrin repeat domain-containing protein [Phenylobacterium sp.]THD61530.1 MAG: ankyrin repeat domain-containing protein [Phenylobacterium sp.]